LAGTRQQQGLLLLLARFGGRNAFCVFLINIDIQSRDFDSFRVRRNIDVGRLDIVFGKIATFYLGKVAFFGLINVACGERQDYARGCQYCKGLFHVPTFSGLKERK